MFGKKKNFGNCNIALIVRSQRYLRLMTVMTCMLATTPSLLQGKRIVYKYPMTRINTELIMNKEFSAAEVNL